jgi:hypothetical protein
MEPDKIMDGISRELMAALKDMAKAKNVDEKLKYSQVVKNLCDSLGMFLELASSMMPFEDDDEGGPMPF